ncbi:MAG: hypothetical protein NVS3B23_09700 [Candidatus Saccharimonadales bacterium]
MHKKLFAVLIAILPMFAISQQLKITDFVILGGNGNCPVNLRQNDDDNDNVGCSVLFGNGSIILGGYVGSSKLIKADESFYLRGNLFSVGTLSLDESANIKGRISVANAGNSKENILSISRNANITGDIDVLGNILIGRNSVLNGKITHPTGTLYTGPTPLRPGGVYIGTPSMPMLPSMPIVNNLAPSTSINITTTQTIKPGAYGYIMLSGNQTLTFSGPGTYIFKGVKNKGSRNSFIYDFKNIKDQSINVYVYDDANIDIDAARLLNGGTGARIFWEVHGTGATTRNKRFAFNLGKSS